MSKHLTRRQEEFCLQWLKHKTVARRAYVASGYNVRSLVVADAASSRLFRSVKVQARIRELQTMVHARAADITADTIANELEEARLIAKGEHQSAAMVSASVAKAKLVGLMVERKEIGDAGDFQRMSEDQLRDYIQGNTPMPKPTHKAPDERQ